MVKREESTNETERECPMGEGLVSNETCAKCFKGTENQPGNIQGDVAEIKNLLGDQADLAARVLVLETYKKDSNRRMVLSLGIVTLVFSVISNLDKIMTLLNGVPK